MSQCNVGLNVSTIRIMYLAEWSFKPWSLSRKICSLLEVHYERQDDSALKWQPIATPPRSGPTTEWPTWPPPLPEYFLSPLVPTDSAMPFPCPTFHHLQGNPGLKSVNWTLHQTWNGQRRKRRLPSAGQRREWRWWKEKHWDQHWHAAWQKGFLRSSENQQSRGCGTHF